tara:strand:- start:257 stop:709 length:453 start_codon:yes stop_codon:yes gene_type:complete
MNNVYYLRLEHIYGLYDKPMKFIPKIIEKIKNDKTIILDDANIVRDFTPVSYVAKVSKELSRNNFKSKLINIGSGLPQTSLEFISKIISVYTTDDKNKYIDIVKSIKIGNINIPVIRESYSTQKTIINDFNYNYFRELELNTIRDLLMQV